MQGDAVKDGRGLPPNIDPPQDKRWERWNVPSLSGWPLLWFHLSRQPFGEIAAAYGPAFVLKWWDVKIGVCIGGHWFYAARWRERWAK